MFGELKPGLCLGGGWGVGEGGWKVGGGRREVGGGRKKNKNDFCFTQIMQNQITCVFVWENSILADLKSTRVIKYRQKTYKAIQKCVTFFKNQLPLQTSLVLLGIPD